MGYGTESLAIDWSCLFKCRYLEEPQQSTTKTSEFPLLVVESVNSKPVKNKIIAETEEVQQLVENCLKARGKWQVDNLVEEVIFWLPWYLLSWKRKFLLKLLLDRISSNLAFVWTFLYIFLFPFLQETNEDESLKGMTKLYSFI